MEFAGTLSDFLREDLKKKYPELMPYVRVTLLNSAQTILTQFDARCGGRGVHCFGGDRRKGMWERNAHGMLPSLGSWFPSASPTVSPAAPSLRAAWCRMQQHAIENFKRVGVEVRTGMRVTGVRPHLLLLLLSVRTAAAAKPAKPCCRDWCGLHAAAAAVEAPAQGTALFLPSCTSCLPPLPAACCAGHPGHDHAAGRGGDQVRAVRV